MHHTNCTTRTYPVGCKYCGRRVHLHLCTCGSVVLFETLGIPWPVHDCRTSSWSPEDQSPTFGIEPERASRIVRAFAEEQGLPVPKLSWERASLPLTLPVPLSPRALDLRRVEPGTAKVKVLGTVRDLIPGVDVFRKLGVRGPLFERQVLRRVSRTATQITLESERGGERLSYTALISVDAPDASRLACGTLVTAELVPIKLAALEAFWLAQSVEILD